MERKLIEPLPADNAYDRAMSAAAFARIMRREGDFDQAIESHRTAIEQLTVWRGEVNAQMIEKGLLDPNHTSVHGPDSFSEYIGLTYTLSRPEAIEAYGPRPLKNLCKELGGLAIKECDYYFAGPAAAYAERSLAEALRMPFSWYHERRAASFFLTKAILANDPGLIIRKAVLTLNGRIDDDPVAPVEAWRRHFKRRMPDELISL